jgi:hypothetical protein
VVLGLLLEYWEPVRDFIAERRKSATALPWKNLMELAGGFLITVGVAGELGFAYKASRVETKLRENNHQIEQLLNKEAGDAKTSAEDAAVASSSATSSARDAKVEADKAQQKAGDVRKQADELNRELLATKAQLAAVDAKRAELEKSLINLAVCSAPRVITRWSLGLHNGAAESFVDPLRPMAGQMVFIEFVPDAEARRAALNIAQALSEAKWNVQTPLRSVDGLGDGVSVQAAVPAPRTLAQGARENFILYSHTTEVQEKLLDYLHSYNWQAASGLPTDAQGKVIHDEKILPAGAIRIQIGLYPPAVYVSPPGEKELASQIEELKQEREKAEADAKRKLEERWATLPPETRQELQKAQAEWDAKTKNLTSNGPCQTLNSPF